jgi:hypothetical protein
MMEGHWASKIGGAIAARMHARAPAVWESLVLAIIVYIKISKILPAAAVWRGTNREGGVADENDANGGGALVQLRRADR